MYTHSRIPQPPHSAGLEYKGLRPRIEASQVPSPIEASEVDRELWLERPYMTLPGSHAPMSTSDFVAVDQGNSSPKFIRISTWNMPSTSRLAADCKLPIAAVIQPFADLVPGEEPIPVVDPGAFGPARCANCRAYVNPWCTWISGGTKWKCNLCLHETEVSTEYFSNLDHNLMRLDHLQRPELNKGTVDFIVHEEYWAQHPPRGLSPHYFTTEPPPTGPKPPAPIDYIFAFDVSAAAVATGFIQTACEALRCILYGGNFMEDTDLEPCFPPQSRVAILTFDQTIHFHDLSSDLAPMLVVPDIEEVFVPLLTGLFVNPTEQRVAIESLLEILPQRFAETGIRESCLGSTLRACLASFSGRGGHSVVFQSTLPTIGIGALSAQPNEADLFDTDKEKLLHKPRDKVWLEIGEECAEEGLAVSMFLAPSSFIDVGSIGAVASITGGELFWHPRFDRSRDADMLYSQFRRLVTRMQGFNCTFRLRCSTGLRISKYYGNFLKSSTTDLDFGILDADKAITIALEHSGRLDPRSYAHLQCALLYTTVDGQRRVRVCNLAMNVVEFPSNVFQYGDMDAVLCLLAREAMSNLSSHKMSTIREELTEKCSSLLLGYRNTCALGSKVTQLIIPEAFKSLPAYTLALQKTKPLKARQVSSDVRNYYAHRIMSMSARGLFNHLYPRLLALHDLEDTAAIPYNRTEEDGSLSTRQQFIMPAHMRNSYFGMEANGIYMIDNDEFTIFWIGSSVSPQLLVNLFGKDDIMALDPRMHKLPVLGTLLSTQVRNILAKYQSQRGRTARVQIARQNCDAAEIEFSDMLVEDQNNGAMSYMDYLAVVHRQITNILTNGTGTFGSGVSIRGSPW